MAAAVRSRAAASSTCLLESRRDFGGHTTDTGKYINGSRSTSIEVEMSRFYADNGQSERSIV